MIRSGEWRAPAAPLNRAFGIFFLILLGSAAVAMLYSGASVGLGSLMRVLLFGISVYVFFYAAYGPGSREPRDAFAQMRTLYWMAVASALFACVDFYFQFPAPAGFGAQFIWLQSGVFRRAQGLFYEASTLGNFCAFFLTMIAAALLGTARRKLRFRGAACWRAAWSSPPPWCSPIRAARCSTLWSAIAVLIYLNRTPHPARQILPGPRVRGCRQGDVRALLPRPWPSPAPTGCASPLPSNIFSPKPRACFQDASRVGARCSNSWPQHPWHALFGIGYKTLPYSDYLGRTVITDNMYLSLLAETGIVGLGAMLWLSLQILRSARRAAASPDPRRRFFGSWILAFWAGQMVQMFTGDLLTYWRVLPLYFWVLAVAVRHEHSVS